MRPTLFLALALLALTQPAPAQDSRERADRGAKAGIEDPSLTEEEQIRAFELVQGFLSEQARAVVARSGARTEEQVDALVSEDLVERLEAYGIPRGVQRDLMAVVHARLTELAEMADRREQGEAGLKEALAGSSLLEEELHPALSDLVEKSRAVGPSLLRRAEEIADEENANALPGQEVEPDPLPVVADYLGERFEGRGLTGRELEDLAEPFTVLIVALGELDDAERFARR